MKSISRVENRDIKSSGQKRQSGSLDSFWPIALMHFYIGLVFSSLLALACEYLKCSLLIVILRIIPLPFQYPMVVMVVEEAIREEEDIMEVTMTFLLRASCWKTITHYELFCKFTVIKTTHKIDLQEVAGIIMEEEVDGVCYSEHIKTTDAPLFPYYSRERVD